MPMLKRNLDSSGGQESAFKRQLVSVFNWRRKGSDEREKKFEAGIYMLCGTIANRDNGEPGVNFFISYGRNR